MRKSGTSLGFLVALTLGLLVGCESEPNISTTVAEEAAESEGKVTVFVSVLPQKRVVEKIGGDRVTVHAMVEEGGDPHSFSASAKQMVALAKADIYFKIGMPFEEQYLPKIQETRPDLTVVSIVDGIELLPMAAHHHEEAPQEEADDGHEGHDHEGHDHEGHDHAHDDHVHEDELDPHVWLSPALLKVMSWNVAPALAGVDSEGTDYFQTNVDQFETELDALDVWLKDKMAPHAGKAIYVFHPAFGYFAEACNLEQKAVEADGQSPSPKQLIDLAGKMKAEQAKVIFTQPQFDSKGAQALGKQVGAVVESIDPLDEDVVGNIERIANAIDAALR